MASFGLTWISQTITRPTRYINCSPRTTLKMTIICSGSFTPSNSCNGHCFLQVTIKIGSLVWEEERRISCSDLSPQSPSIWTLMGKILKWLRSTFCAFINLLGKKDLPLLWSKRSLGELIEQTCGKPFTQLVQSSHPRLEQLHTGTDLWTLISC